MTAHAPGARQDRLHVDAWLLTVVALATTLAALATWVVVDRFSAGSAGGDATALVDDLNAAANARDGTALRALLAEDAVMVSLGETHTGAGAIVRQLAGAAGAGLRIERIAPVSRTGEYATTFQKYTSGQETGIMLAAFQLRDGKILRIWGMQPPVMPPMGGELGG